MKLFREPPARFRPAPFWSVNADLSGAEMRKQVRMMHRAGLGGFFYHSRVGLVTPYLSEEWFDRIRDCVNEARKLKMEAWLYDEDKWPSGFAGGLLLDRFPEFRIKDLCFGCSSDVAAAREEARKSSRNGVPGSGDRPGERFEPLADFAVRRAGKSWKYRPLREGEGPRRGEEALSFLLHHGPDSNWNGGHSYVDLMDPACIREFIRMTHAEYQRRFRRDIGRTIPGIFTDEPNNHEWGASVPWSRGFERDMAGAVRGGVGRLPALILRTPDAAEVRHAFLAAISRRFTESFTRQIYRYCSRVGMALTGHMLLEDDLKGNCKYSGGVMPHYEWMHVPGIDHLLRQAGARLTHRQVSSVARQMGKPRVMCEIFGVSGHSMTFEDFKWIGDWHLLNGVNYFVPHLTLQTMAGHRKRDYPPTISWHQPYWNDIRGLFDYFARLGCALRQGRAVADVLVLHPIDSAWVTHEWDEGPIVDWVPRPNPAQERYDAGVNAVMEGLAKTQRDFDLGDGTILARHARVAGRMVRVGSGGSYRAVVVPPSCNWRESTVRLLEKAARTGLPVLFAGEVPAMVDGRPARARWARLLRAPAVSRCGTAPASLDRALSRAGISPGIRLKVTGRGAEVFSQHRVSGREHLYFFINRGRKAGGACRAVLAVRGMVERLDPATGGVSPHPSADSGGGTGIAFNLPPVGSALFRVTEGRAGFAAIGVPRAAGKTVKLGAPESIGPDSPNILVLDRCEYSINGASDGKPHPVFEARKAAFDAAGLAEFAGLQPWRMKHLGVAPRRTANVELKFRFRVEADPPRMDMVIETPECYSASLNGRPVPLGISERWLGDPKLRRVRLGLPRRGENELVLSGEYGLAMEIEDIFLLGRFCVSGSRIGPFTVRRYSPPSGFGNWGAKGFPFYAGCMTYRFRARVPEAGRWLLRLGRASGSVFRIRVDGRDRGKVWRAPWKADLGRLSRGTHPLEVTVVSTLQNAFGPLHNRQYREKGYCWWIGPEGFVNDQVPEYHLHPYGLLESPVLLRA